MFHLHHLIFFPFFVLFHLIGVIFLFVAIAVVAKAFRRRRIERGGASDSGDAPRLGNAAFDDYRRATLRKLELEAEEFRKYLDGLRRAADGAAFDTFLKSRRAEAGPAQ